MKPLRRILRSTNVIARAWLAMIVLTAAAEIAPSHVALGADSIDEAVKAIQSIGTAGEGFDRAIPAAAQLQQLSSSEIPRVLDGASGGNPIVENWIRGVVFGIAKNAGPPDAKTLQAYIEDHSNNPIGRGIAMELLRQQQPDLAKTMIDACLNDPSLAIREMAVEQAIGAASSIAKSEPQQAIDRYRVALEAARHPKQLARIVEALNELGDSVTTSSAFALITAWKAVAPFDNVGGVGFDTVYPPEESFATTAKVDLEAEYDGKSGAIGWQTVDGANDEGMVDLAAAFAKEKGAVAYLYTEFDVSMDQPAQVRLGCTNANKVWVNGKEVMANEVYHSGNMLDQYVAPCELRQGTNQILLKICQNEQEESWAQAWEFQFRLTDPSGKGLMSGQ